jgi:hypothetical protein
MNQDPEYSPIIGFPNYAVSKCGNVISLKTQKVIKPFFNSRGYLRVQICDANKIKRQMFVHRLVCQTFIPNHEQLPIIDHIDRNKLNNHADNLRWSTRRDNALNIEPRRKKDLSLFANANGARNARSLTTDFTNITEHANNYMVVFRKTHFKFRKTYKTLQEAIAVRDALRVISCRPIRCKTALDTSKR